MKKLLCILMMFLCMSAACAEETFQTLVVYFAVADNSEVDAVSSASVAVVEDQPMGRISALANLIHSGAGGDIVSLDVNAVYPADIMELLDYAQNEQDENLRPLILNPIENINQYNTIFIGYPLWWYDLPMAVYSFFDDYDLSGKTIIPFCTHNGSRFSGTIDTIEELEPNATVVRNGFTVSEHDVLDAEDDVLRWLKEIGF